MTSKETIIKCARHLAEKGLQVHGETYREWIERKTRIVIDAYKDGEDYLEAIHAAALELNKIEIADLENKLKKTEEALATAINDGWDLACDWYNIKTDKAILEQALKEIK